MNKFLRLALDTKLSKNNSHFELLSGTAHGGEDIEPGTLHGGEDIEPGTLHGGEDIDPWTLHGD